MAFSPNSAFMYAVAVLVILFVLAQSVFFLVRAYRRALQLGISPEKLKKTILSTAVFTLAPAISFLLGVVTLSKFLGIPLPWIRLSVVGALTYELPAATSTANALGISLSELITDPKVYSAIAWVMTLGILPSIILPPILMKKIQGGMMNLRKKDEKWSDIFMTSLFLGMISAFLGMVFADIRSGISQPRNKKLAEVFHRLRLIESYGTGIRRIFKLYENCPVQPSIEVTANAFKIVLPNMNANGAVAESALETAEKAPVTITPQMKTVMDYLAEYGEMTNEDLQELLNIKKTRAYLLARQMHENGLIEIIGRGAAKKYRLK